MNSCCHCQKECEDSIHECDQCQMPLCHACTDYPFSFQPYGAYGIMSVSKISNDPPGVMRLNGCMVVYNKNGVGNKYCMSCYQIQYKKLTRL